MKERKGKKSLDRIGEVVKDPLVRQATLRTGLSYYEKLLRDSNVGEADVERSTQILANIVKAPKLSQTNARRLLVFFESIKRPE